MKTLGSQPQASARILAAGVVLLSLAGLGPGQPGPPLGRGAPPAPSRASHGAEHGLS